jgi:hypothetical protein
VEIGGELLEFMQVCALDHFGEFAIWLGLRMWFVKMMI